jgi:hypothetical protein
MIPAKKLQMKAILTQQTSTGTQENGKAGPSPYSSSVNPLKVTT